MFFFQLLKNKFHYHHMRFHKKAQLISDWIQASMTQFFSFFLGPLGVLCLVLTKKSSQYRWPPGRAVQSTDKITNTDVHL